MAGTTKAILRLDDLLEGLIKLRKAVMFIVIACESKKDTTQQRKKVHEASSRRNQVSSSG